MLIDVIIAGLTIGSIYALVGVAFVIVILATGFINFAQGDFMMAGAFLFLTLRGLGAPDALALPLIIVMLAAAGGLMERVAVRPFWVKEYDPGKIIIITLAIGLLMSNLALRVYGGRPLRVDPLFGGEAIGVVRAGPFAASFNQLMAIGTVALTMVLLAAFFKFTMTGVSLRAVMIDRDTASLMGVSIKRTVLLSFVIGAGFAALAGMLIAPLTFVRWNMGLTAIKAFAGATLGGLYSVRGAVAGCVLLGVLETLISGFVSSAYRDAIVYGILIVVLLVRPQGLLASRQVERVG